jgi:hypothetical protein
MSQMVVITLTAHANTLSYEHVLPSNAWQETGKLIRPGSRLWLYIYMIRAQRHF